MRRALVALATALLVVTAGCAGMTGTATPGADGGAGGDGAASGGDDASATDAGTVNFYVSDQPNDMDDFEHLNVTITSIRFHLVDAAANGSADGAANASTATPANATVTTTATATPANGTAADDGNETEADDEDEADADDEREDEEMGDEGEDMDDDEAGDGDGRWVTRDVNATSVDLSQLRGANATLLEQFDLPAGEYDAVHMAVGEVNGTLTDGDDQRVKLPSDKLQLNSEFTVENGSAVDFVYDVSVHEAGNSGKYILKPVVSESGTEVPIERVDDGDRDDDGDERSIDASFVGDATAGETVTVRVTENGSALANATVSVGDGPAGTTDADGEYVVSVPSDAEELEIEVEDGDAEAELAFESDADDADEPGDDGPGDGGASRGD